MNPENPRKQILNTALELIHQEKMSVGISEFMDKLTITETKACQLMDDLEEGCYLK